MAKFCIYCGRPLAEGEVCNCQAGAQPNPAPQAQPQYNQVPPQQAQPQYNQVPPQQAQPQYNQVPPQQAQAQYNQVPPQPQPQPAPQPQKPAEPSKAGLFFKSLLAIITKPAEGVKAFVDGEHFLGAIIIIAAEALIIGLLGMETNGKWGMGYWLPVLGKIGVYFGGFITSIVMVFIFAAAFMGYNLILGIITKNGMNFKKSMALSGVRSLVMVPFSAFSLLFGFAAPKLAIVFFAIGLIGGAVFTTLAIPEGEKGKAQNPLFIFGLHCVFFAIGLIFIWCTGWLLPGFYTTIGQALFGVSPIWS